MKAVLANAVYTLAEGTVLEVEATSKRLAYSASLVSAASRHRPSFHQTNTMSDPLSNMRQAQIV